MSSGLEAVTEKRYVLGGGGGSGCSPLKSQQAGHVSGKKSLLYFRGWQSWEGGNSRTKASSPTLIISGQELLQVEAGCYIQKQYSQF